MNNSSHKHDGSHSAGSSHATPATNGTKNVTNNKKSDTCRDYMWGKCTKGSSCRFRHELDFEKIKKTVKFCHDYQNRAPCTREVCTFIHATKDEETLFLTTGKLPKVLAERHANMSMSSAETIPQIAIYIQESLAGPPPPPPPPQAAPQPSSVKGPQVTYNMGQMASPMQPGMGMGSMHIGPMNMGHIPPQMMSMPGPSMVAPPPPAIPMQHLPPPPPPPPTQSSTRSSLTTPPVYTAPTPPTMRVSLNQELSRPATPKLNMDRFDPSKPPPPFVPNTSLKRPTVSDSMKAGPSKIRKEEEAIVDDSACDPCRQRQIRIDVYQKETDKIYARVEFQKLIHKKKYEEFQRKEEILKILLNPEIYKIIEDLLLNEDGPQVQESDNQNAIGDLTPPRTVESLGTLMTRPSVNSSIQNSLLFAEHLRDGNKKRDDQSEYNHNNTYHEETRASYSQSLSVPTTSKTQSSNPGKNVPTTATPSYFYYNMPPPITRPFMTPSTSIAPTAGASLMAYQHNGMQGPSQAMTKPSPSGPPPPSKPNNLSNQNSAPYPPPTSYYNSYQ
ncbi:unnamed protein product [Pieris brassicae]|uniref:C3H1-type domain-containing protein n=1 Tax=Pieris brassicae TaxID=7116 RepID=A0A9P0U1H5_PIEBR|nr:unnamed protein product [Pieris brassicae]